MQIITTYWPKPIPDRSCDWEAVLENYDGGDPIGHGATEEAAIDDLKMQLDDDVLEMVEADEDEEAYANSQFGVGA